MQKSRIPHRQDRTAETGCNPIAPVFRLLPAGRVLILLAVVAFSLRGLAQTTSDRIEPNFNLPNAPAIQPAAAIQLPLPTHDSSGHLSGVVADINGYLVPDAQITLSEHLQSIHRVATSDELGAFSFAGLPPGSYTVTIESKGLQPYTSDAIALGAGESFALPTFELQLPPDNADIQVVASQDQVAQAQVKLAEHQRVLGIVPNFYSSYIWNAAPMTTRLKFDLALRSTTDPVTFLLAGGVAGVEQFHNTFPGYEAGFEGYSKRHAAAYADNVVGRMIGSAILPSLLHQDPRYFYKGKGSVMSRAAYAIGATFITRGDNGHLQPNYSHILGNFAASGFSNLYRTDADRSAGLTIRNGFIITGTNAIGNLVREFLIKGVTHNVPSFAQGQP